MNKKALLISCYDWYNNRLKPIRDYLMDIGYDVTAVMSDYCHINKSYINVKIPECNYIHVPSYKSNISLQRIWSHMYFGKKVNQYLKNFKPDLVYLVLPPNNTAYYCASYKKQHPECKYIVDIIDLWPESLPLNFLKKTFPARIWANLRNYSLRFADHMFLECGLYKEKLKGVIPNIDNKSSILYLFKEQSQEEHDFVLKTINQYEKEKQLRQNKIILGYLGSINNIIDIDGISSVVKSLKEKNLEVEVRIIGDGQSRDKFIRELEYAGAKVRYFGKIFDQFEKIKILGMCDFGLNMMKDNISVGLTIKSIDYFSMGLPIINSIKGDTWEMVISEHIGENWSDGNEMLDIGYNHNEIFRVFLRQFSLSSFELNLIDKPRNIFQDWR